MLNNKKGDVTISTVILIILGLAVLVFLVIGLTQGWDIFFGNVGKVDPGDLQVVAQACKGYAQAGLGISYCEFKKINLGGDDEYVNCIDSRIEPVVSEGYSGSKPTCTGQNTVLNFCLRGGKIQPNKLTVTKINGQTCSGIGVSSAECATKDGSKVVASACSCPKSDGTTAPVQCIVGQICNDGACTPPAPCPSSGPATLACKCIKAGTTPVEIICNAGKTCVNTGADPVCN